MYTIDGTNQPLSIMPTYFSLSTICPTICTLYEGHSPDLYNVPSYLPQASDPSFQSFNQFTGELIVSTTNVNYAGLVMPLTIECVLSRMNGFGWGYFNTQFELQFTIPNGCIANIDPSASYIEDQMLVWGEDMIVPAFEPYTYTSDNCDGYTITYEAQQKLPNGSLFPLPNEISFNPLTREFYAKKCLSGDPNNYLDPECDTENVLPFTKEFQVVVIATL